ncbi:hypothetical protein KAR91_61510 [Candidatus Pacearchaeota archaeon]|nr:hypothetical protein [Candidatus Pacearchaeota archaeon]
MEVLRIEKIDPLLKAAIKIRAIQEKKTMREFIIETLAEKVEHPKRKKDT